MMHTCTLNPPWPETPTLPTVLNAGAILSGEKSEDKASNPSGLPHVLRTRLHKFDATLDGVERSRSLDLPSLQLDTAFASLYVLERVHNILLEHDAQHSKESSVPPLVGAKDIQQMRTHLSVVFNWGTDLLLSRVLPTVSNRPTRPSRLPPDAHIIDLTAAHENTASLSDCVMRFLNIILPEGPRGASSTTFVAMAVLSRGLTDLLRACICLGWLPNELNGDLPSVIELRPYVSRLLNGSQPAQSITALGTIMRKHSRRPLYIQKVCKMLLTEQLLRSAGIVGLFSSVFGEDVSSTEAPLEKLQSTADVLKTVPPNMSREEYYSTMIPRLLHLLSPAMDKPTPPSHRRAAAFALSRMLDMQMESEVSAYNVQRKVVGWCLLDSFKLISRSKTENAISEVPDDADDISSTSLSVNSISKARAIAESALVLPPSQAVPTLSTIFMNADPSPGLINILLQPIAPQLYMLLECLCLNVTADPILRETVEGLLNIWARVAGKAETVDALWEVIEGGAGEWDTDDEGELRVYGRLASLPSLTLAQLADLQEGKLDTEENEEANPLNLCPHPLHFVQFLKSLKRDDVASALYLRILDAHVRMDSEENPLRKLLLFKLSMRISEEVGADVGPSSPIRQPDVTRILLFVRMSLGQGSMLRDSESGGFSRETFRFVPEDDGDEEHGDSDDEDLAPGLEGVDKHEHLSVTAVNLLLALLQEHEDLSPRTVPLLNDIYAQLEPLTHSESDALRPIAREARITLTARLASSNTFPTKEVKKDPGEETSQEKYQRALKLLQDPILPVRAHGLLLLRELVAPVKAISTKKGEENRTSGSEATVSIVQGATIAGPSLDAALVPGVLSIFMQAVQDDDSYIFLNAVQGLAAMVDGFGREVLHGLVDEYDKGLKGVGGSQAAMTTRDVDLRVRVGEALGQIIKRCGSALGIYVNIIVPRLFAVVRASHLPTTLRTSAVSLLATAADTNALALIAYSADLLSAMVDLVQIESVRADSRTAPKGHSADMSGADSVFREESGRTNDLSTDDVETGRKSQFRDKEAPKRGTSGCTASEFIGKPEIASAPENTLDARPTATNAKFPPLRRAALHFSSLLLRSLTARIYGGNQISEAVPSGPGIKRMMTVLGYVSVSDEDRVVRVMAREAVEQIQQLRNVMLGL